MVVVLPEPFGPRKPYTEPAGTARSRPFTATWPPRNRLVSPGSWPACWIAGCRASAGHAYFDSRGVVEQLGVDRADEGPAVIGEQCADQQRDLEQPAAAPAALDRGQPAQHRSGRLAGRTVRRAEFGQPRTPAA